MSGERFLASLRKVIKFGKIVMLTSALKENLNFWEEDTQVQ